MPEPHRVAIVGGGPRGLFALDSLVGCAHERPERRLAITLYEPGAYPGAGPVYAPDQPAYLLMNFAAGKIDAWDRRFAYDEQRLSLVGWGETGPGASIDPGAYVPRATVGRYLMACLDTLRARLPANVTLECRRCFITALTYEAGQWCLAHAAGRDQADEVLIVTGHQRWQSAEATQPVSVFPVQRLARAIDTADGPVRCRGFGLTFIDAALALTVGRGGAFERDERGTLTYRASGHEPGPIQPVSRTGRPMLAKPDAGVVTSTAARERIVEDLAARLANAERPVTDFVGRLWPCFLEAADAYIDAVPGTTADWFTRWAGARPEAAASQALMAESLAMATGQCAPGPALALALVWRGAYPALIRLVSHDGLAERAMPGFREVATEMERIAFGPPAVNVERLLALVRAGRVDLSRLGTRADDIAIDATIAAPGRPDPGGPLPDLIDRWGLARTAAGTLAIDMAGRPRRETGQPIPGLAIIGRMTELSVLGNDTLSRRLHDTMHQWARHVVDAPMPAANHHVSVDKTQARP